MDIKPTIGKFTVYASEYCELNSDVINGGGSDDTDMLQSILDMAKKWGSLHLIMDGAALIRGLRVHSNTTIECMNSDCGFFLADYSDDALIKNADLSVGEIKNRNIVLKGGSYNHNCRNQNKTLPEEKHFPVGERCCDPTTAFKFYGVESFVMDGVTIIDQKRYAFQMGNWKNVDIKNVHIPLPHEEIATNQDGLHFHGPGEHLRITNVWGRTGDDFIALNTDEGDGVSSVSDVVIDGIYLDESDQAIRILSWNKGKIDNVVIRNVSGTFRSYGFFIQPYFKGDGGNIGNITFENINLRQTNHVYFGQPRLFHIAGNIENITMKNISTKYNADDYVAFLVGNSYEGDDRHKEDTDTYIKHLSVDGLYISDENENHSGAVYINVERNMETLKIKNVIIDRLQSMKNSGCILNINKNINIKNFTLESVQCENIADEVKYI